MNATAIPEKTLQEFRENFNKKKYIKRIIRNRKRNSVGMLVAYKDDNTIRIGWSLCKTKIDRFNKDFALYLCCKRAEKYIPNNEQFMNHVPHSLKEFMTHFIERSKKYFKI